MVSVIRQTSEQNVHRSLLSPSHYHLPHHFLKDIIRTSYLSETNGMGGNGGGDEGVILAIPLSQHF